MTRYFGFIKASITRMEGFIGATLKDRKGRVAIEVDPELRGDPVFKARLPGAIPSARGKRHEQGS